MENYTRPRREQLTLPPCSSLLSFQAVSICFGSPKRARNQCNKNPSYLRIGPVQRQDILLKEVPQEGPGSGSWGQLSFLLAHLEGCKDDRAEHTEKDQNYCPSQRHPSLGSSSCRNPVREQGRGGKVLKEILSPDCVKASPKFPSLPFLSKLGYSSVLVSIYIPWFWRLKSQLFYEHLYNLILLDLKKFPNLREMVGNPTLNQIQGCLQPSCGISLFFMDFFPMGYFFCQSQLG